MLTTLAACLIPVVTACQLAALAVLWRRYRMPGAGWWLAATVLICIGTTGQAIEETGWRPDPLVALVNTLCIWGAMAEYVAARHLTGQPAPPRRHVRRLMLLGACWALLAAVQAGRSGWDPVLYGWLRVPGLLVIAVAETAIAISLYRLGRRSGTVGAYLAALGYGLLVAALPSYPFSYEHAWLRTAGMANAAFSFILVGWGLLLIVLERRQAELQDQTVRLAAEVARHRAQADDFERLAVTQEAQLAWQSDRGQLGTIALDLAADLLDTVETLRTATRRLGYGEADIERQRLADRIARVLEDMSLTAHGLRATGQHGQHPATRVDCRKLLEQLLQALVPAEVGLMKAWPASAVWLTTDETLLRVALHQAIRWLLTTDRPVRHVSVILADDDGLSLTLRQALANPVAKAGPADDLGLKVAQLAVQRLGGRLDVLAREDGTGLLIWLPVEPGLAADPAGRSR
jgi:hypothetical protein